jgi:hypothetical protein
VNSFADLINSLEPATFGLTFLALVMALIFVRFWLKHLSNAKDQPLGDGSPGGDGPGIDIDDWSGGLNSCGVGGD